MYLGTPAEKRCNLYMAPGNQGRDMLSIAWLFSYRSPLVGLFSVIPMTSSAMKELYTWAVERVPRRRMG